MISIDFSNFNFCDIVESIKSFIVKNKCDELSADISFLSLPNAARTALLCSTFHFVKYPRGKILWKVADEETKRAIASMKLRNMKLLVKGSERKMLAAV